MPLPPAVNNCSRKALGAGAASPQASRISPGTHTALAAAAAAPRSLRRHALAALAAAQHAGSMAPTLTVCSCQRLQPAVLAACASANTHRHPACSVPSSAAEPVQAGVTGSLFGGGASGPCTPWHRQAAMHRRCIAAAAAPADAAFTTAATAVRAALAARQLHTSDSTCAAAAVPASATARPTAAAAATGAHATTAAAGQLASASASAPAGAAPQPQPRREGAPLAWASLGELGLMQQRFLVGRSPFSVVAPQDVDAVMDMYINKGLNDADPYWTRVWPSAIALAGLLLQRPELVRGKVVADLGAGLGLAGVAAALAGAREVVLLDREPLALQCALVGAAGTVGDRVQVLPLPASQVPAHGALVQHHHHCGSPAAHQGRGAGGNSADAAGQQVDAVAEAMKRWLRQAAAAQEARQPPLTATNTLHEPAGQPLPLLRAHTFDWTAPPGMHELLPPQAGTAGARPAAARRFDVVLACDVLYEQEAVGPITDLLPRLLAPAGGRLLLADPPNRTARNRERFLQAATSAGGVGGAGLRLALEECSVASCEVAQLDPEMAGGMVASESIPVQLVVLRSVVGKDTIGIKPRE